MMSRLHSAFVIGRRDFMATVASKSFLFFLLGPLFPVAMGLLFGNLGERFGQQDNIARVTVVADAATQARILAADRVLGPALDPTDQLRFTAVPPAPDEAAQVRALLADEAQKADAVWTGGLQAPRLTGTIGETGRVRRDVSFITSQARAQAASPDRPVGPADVALTVVNDAAGERASLQTLTARFGQVLLFILTVLLATMLLSNLVEEKSNKIIEILAAAVPVDAIFLGKLFAMLMISLVGLAVWVAAGAIAASIWLPDDFSIPQPAVGWPAFIALGLLYYAAAYLLLGALFLGVGAQATSVREVQVLSMPATMAQVVVFALASFAVGKYDEPIGIGAAIFPLSSPYVMLARAAERAEFWPHLLALAWQALWVVIFIRVAAGFFRRSVLKSGGASAGEPKAKRGLFARA